eukprot:TRINITY_DN11417_c0_g1_i3.p1 TRINITY_DN11417_c0_g1~~TRINITY_DN11417_c0_g1_i3.p1  ORF type:complete len:264 (-),score=47.29 TRINITY_DN11417_c0_g1_i3:142-933(-)
MCIRDRDNSSIKVPKTQRIIIMMRKRDDPKLGNDILFYAVAHANVKDVIGLLEENEADVNARSVNGSTPLHFGVCYENASVVEILLKYRADPNLKEYPDVGEYSPLHRAVEKNNIEICRLLLKYGANPSSQAKNGFTPLHVAAKNGFTECAELLLMHGVDVNLRDQSGFTAEYWASLKNFKDIQDAIKKFAEEHQIKLAKGSITLEEIIEHRFLVRLAHKIEGKGGKKGKKGKKKKQRVLFLACYFDSLQYSFRMVVICIEQV